MNSIHHEWNYLELFTKNITITATFSILGWADLPSFCSRWLASSYGCILADCNEK